MLKLSDFGLHKTEGSDLTSTGTSMKGTIRDPTLDSFKDFDVLAEIYAVGSILSFIFSGRDSLGACTGAVGDIVDKCTNTRRELRYGSVLEVIAGVEALDFMETEADAPG